MTLIRIRQDAIRLRLKGKTYSEIKEKLNVSKSTLSDWLSKFPLTEEQMALLNSNKKNKKNLAIEKTRLIKQKKRAQRLERIYRTQEKYWLNLKKRELKLAGLFLYWGEGNKRINGPVSLNNTDPDVLKFTLYWLCKGLNVRKEDVKVYLHLYSDMDKEVEMEYWSKELSLSISQFRKPYIKTSNRSDLDQKGFGHGTCGLVVNDVRLKENIMMGIKAIANRL